MLSLAGCQSIGSGRSLSLRNPGFEEPAALSKIPGWLQSQHVGAPGEIAYEMAMDSGATPESKQSLRVTRLINQIYGLVDQKVSVLPEDAGKILNFSALLKTQNVGPEGWLLVVNMNSAFSIIEQAKSLPVTGTSDWHRVSLRTLIPSGTVNVSAGFLLLDAGSGWADDATLLVE